MPEYILYIHHDKGLEQTGDLENAYKVRNDIGHFYLELRSDDSTVAQERNIFSYGPRIEGRAIFSGHIDDKDKERVAKFANKKELAEIASHITKRVDLTREEYLKAYDAADKVAQKPGTYIGTVHDCIEVTQQIYEATGRRGDFVDLYATAELQGLNSLAARWASVHYGAGDRPNFVKWSGSKEDLASHHGVPIERVVPIMGHNSLYLGNDFREYAILPDGRVKTDAIGRKLDYNPSRIVDKWKGINTNQAAFTPFGSEAIDSFIGTHWSGFSSLSRNLFMPFSAWSQFNTGSNPGDPLNVLRQMGFATQYNTHSSSDYTHSIFLKVSSSDHTPNSYEHVLQGYQRSVQYQHIQQQTFRMDHQASQNHHYQPSHHQGSWQEVHYSRGYGYRYSTPGSGFSIEIARTHPIAIDLKGDGISIVKYEDSSVFFDVDDDQYYENTCWVGNTDAILVYDHNENGVVDFASEIVLTKWDERAKSDFEALKYKFDSNQDGIFNVSDDEFRKFYLWQDLNQDGFSQAHELTLLGDSGLQAISLDFEEPSETDKQLGILRRAKITWANNQTSYAYDLVLTYSLAGLRASAAGNDIVIEYKKGNTQKIYESEADEATQLSFDFNEYDVVLGSSMNDSIRLLGNRAVIVDAGDGDDAIVTGNGNDWVKGGSGKDSIKTGTGHDVLIIDADDEDIDAGEGFDVAFVSSSKGIRINLANTNLEAIYCNSGDDYIDGSGAKAVHIHGNAGNDELIGSDGDDILVGGPGIDKIRAGKGDDKIFIDHEDDLTEIDSGEGEDTLYSMSDIGVTVDMDSVNAENFFGGKGNDKATASSGKKYILSGGEGDDELIGGAGSNILDGGPGNDTLHGGAGNNKYMFSRNYGHDVIYTKGKSRGDNKDLVLLSSEIKLEDIVFTRKGDDLVLSLKDNDSSLTFSKWFLGDEYKVHGFIYRADDQTNAQYIILYESPNKLILKDDHNWIVFAIDGDKEIEDGTGSEFIVTGSGNDLVMNCGGKDKIYTGDGNDSILGCTLKDIKDMSHLSESHTRDSVEVYAGNGDDVILGRDGDDLLDGGEGNDHIFGYDGNDRIFTGGGDDYVDGGSGNDEIIIQGTGKKQIYGRQGSDRFVIEPSNSNDRAIFGIIDFELNNKGEVIDFSRIEGINSFDDLWWYKKSTVNIDPELSTPTKFLTLTSTEKKTMVAVALCWKDDLHCVFLAGISFDQILTSKESFVFRDSNAISVFDLHSKLICTNGDLYGRYSSLNFNATHTFSEHKGVFFALAALGQSCYMAVIKNVHEMLIEIYDHPSKLDAAYIDSQQNVTVKIKSCNNAGLKTLYNSKTINEDATKVVGDMQRWLAKNAPLENYKCAIFNDAGETVYNMIEPSKIDPHYLSGINSDLYFACTAY